MVKSISKKTNSRSSREILIDILSQEWPLSAKELHNRVCKESGVAVSYQAIHKLVNTLEDENVLLKQGKSYQLDSVWIEKQESYFCGIKKGYQNKVGGYEGVSPNVEQAKIVFDDYSRFCVETAVILAKQKFIGNGPNIGVGIFSHTWWPLRFNFRDFEVFIKMAKSMEKTYAIVRSDSPLDHWLGKQWQMGGFGEIKLGKEISGINQDVLVHGDSVWQISFSKELEELRDEIYGRTSDLNGLFKEYFLHPKSKIPHTVEITLTRNSIFAESMRKNILSYFNGGVNDDTEDI
jgi:hypothetical protein